ncbi:PREDICTED: ribonuclease P protein subunit p25-like [Condylura cristata]|uniref:ribonuclease P protein subunit p25-like n=1 Tax=Condylura cristata TaxID=143302 RepID=UPI00033472F4|nr:PREDICTED: ribonuclease P protein subunit p25-like [Condylura cristata]
MQSQDPHHPQGDPRAQPGQRRKLPKVCSEGESRPEGSVGFCPFLDLAPGALQVWVKDGSKIRNLLAFAAIRMEKPSMRTIVFNGIGHATSKTISCVEILKRRVGGLHQVTRLYLYSAHELAQLPRPWPLSTSRPTSHRTVPGLSILLSKDALNPRQLGYQLPSPQHGPSIQPMTSASSSTSGEPSAVAGSAKESSPCPGVPPEDPSN